MLNITAIISMYMYNSFICLFLYPATGAVYLMLLNADYNKSPCNKYIAKAVNYTLSIETVECLSWDGVKQRKPRGCFSHGGVSPDKIYCRYELYKKCSI